MDLPKTKKVKKKSKVPRSNSNSSSLVLSPRAAKSKKIEPKEVPNYMKPTKQMRSPKNENYQPIIRVD